MNRTSYVFDVDGTLTPSRGTMDPEFKEWFSEFCDNNLVYLVTGSDRPKTLEQIGSDVYNKCSRVYQCSGNEVWVQENTVRSSNWTLPVVACDWLSTVLMDSQFPLRTGQHFEHRTGMCNFSVVGRSATIEQRKQYVKWDKLHHERDVVASNFNYVFPEFQATVGGETGIDIALKGSDKSQILRDFDDSNRIMFYGDAMHQEGNDYPLAHAMASGKYGGQSFNVHNWEHTWELIQHHGK